MKLLKATLFSILAIAMLLLIVVGIMFGGEIMTVLNLKQVEGTDLFVMDYKGDYGLDKFLEKGASSDGEVVQFVSKQLLKGIPFTFDLPDLGCSTFAVENQQGEKIFARNFDMYYSPPMVVKTHPKNGYASISMVNLAYIGYGKDNLPISIPNRLITLAAPYAPMDGMNEKGLSIGVLLIQTDPTKQSSGKIPITTSTAIRLVLDKAATVDEALELLQSYDMHASAGSSYHFQIADATGKAVVVEYIENVFSIVESKMATNFLLTPGEWYRFGKGQDRFETVKSTIEEKNGVLSQQEAMELLQSVSQDKPATEPGGKESQTQWSAVYNNTKGTLDLVVRLDYDKVHTFTIN